MNAHVNGMRQMIPQTSYITEEEPEPSVIIKEDVVDAIYIKLETTEDQDHVMQNGTTNILDAIYIINPDTIEDQVMLDGSTHYIDDPLDITIKSEGSRTKRESPAEGRLQSTNIMDNKRIKLKDSGNGTTEDETIQCVMNLEESVKCETVMNPSVMEQAVPTPLPNRDPPTPCLLGLIQDHSYTNVEWSQDNINKDTCKLNNRIVAHLPNEHELENSEPAKGKTLLCSLISRSDHITATQRYKPGCHNHPDMFELKHEKLVKIGDKFSSALEFMVYLNSHAKEWLYYYHCYTSHRKRCEDVVVRCVFTKRKLCPSSYKSRGLRKRKSAPDYNCPCRIVMVRPRGDEHYIVTRVCNHHSHELTEEAFLGLSHTRRLLPEMKEEIDDLLSIGASTNTMRRYVQYVAGLTVESNFFMHRKKLMQRHNIVKQFSEKKLEELTDKIKMFQRKPPPGDTKKNTILKQIVNREEESRIFSTLAAEEKPAGKQSNAKRSKKAEDEVTNKRSRLETTLDNLSYDQELLESVRLLQEGYTNSTQPLNDTTSLTPAATTSHAVTTPNSALLKKEHDTSGRDLDPDFFSADYNDHGNNDFHYNLDTCPQSEVIDENVPSEVIDENVEDKQSNNYVALKNYGNVNDNTTNYDISDQGNKIEDNLVRDIDICQQYKVIVENVDHYEYKTFNFEELYNKENGNDCTANGIENKSVYSTDVVYNSQSENVYSDLLQDIPYVNENSELNAQNQDIHHGNIRRGSPNNSYIIRLGNINNTNQTKIKSKNKVHSDFSNCPQIIDSHIIAESVKIVDSFKNTEKLKLKEQGTQTDDEFPNRDKETRDELLNNKLIYNTRTIIKDLKLLNESSTVYINKYNIDQCIMQEVLHKYFHRMARTMSITICNLFCNIYSGKAVIKMNVKYTGSNMSIIMTYVTENIPVTVYNQSENIISRYKHELNDFYHALMTARDKIYNAEEKIKCSKCETNDVENKVPNVFENNHNNNHDVENHQQNTEAVEKTNGQELNEIIEIQSESIVKQ